ncbi:hypothetical protein [Flavobacterium sp.]|uniref:hypothetical protein n=1 Tax=Flavobacterium sp. TaxID=239 RepID=UPI0031DFC6A0
MEKLIELQLLVKRYEERKATLIETISSIKDLIGKEITQYELDSYNASQDLENFCKVLLIEPINDWNSIDDEKALILIVEILDNVNDHVIISRNCEALEKRYHKSQGTVMEMIFDEELNENEILIQLKKDTAIQL